MAFTSQPGVAQPGLFHPGDLESDTLAVSGADTASATETGSLSVALSGTDTGSGTETQSSSASFSNTDTGSGTDSGTLVVAVSSSDTGSGTDTGSVSVAVTTSDTASTVETDSVSVTTSDTDTGSADETESLDITVQVSQTDTSSGTETQSFAAALSDSDTNAGADSEDINELGDPNPDDADTAFSEDTHSFVATLPTSGDTSSAASESESVSVNISSSDTGSATDSSGSVSVAVSSSDTASLSGETSDFEFGAEGLDTASVSESHSIAVTLSSSDGAAGVDSHTPFPAGPVEIGDYAVSLVMGPATVYIADFESPEPLDSDITTDPSSLYWVDIGTTLDGVTILVKHEFESPELVQVPDKAMSRLKRRRITASFSMAEPTLNNILYALDNGTLDSGVGYSSYTPPAVMDRATPLTYRAVMIDGWAPGFSETNENQHRRRRVILRKCLSIEGTNMTYSKDKLTSCDVTWAVHRIDGTTPPFKIIDEE